ncbi:hypothetical protein PAXRUDRAFT_142530 [Paxillus rubicundulus Ve08.2h10]|uniref:Uncharacterized protein n=1 Tax=Paxillus rubicundulus Ve08.2h10 TaxID=930991 RepID=A0A0D0E839_9AGAM|nr:hypothetical protein PAXRUDRAFT_142530 [Paxillus rubicundulus Ve08.2h10]
MGGPGCRVHDLQGCINVSPAWFQQGHMWPKHVPKVSVALKCTNSDDSDRKWVQNMDVPLAILSATLLVMHPDLYTAGPQAFLQISDLVYSGTSVMVNHSIPWHRDLNSKPQWLNLLTTIGDYFTVFCHYGPTTIHLPILIAPLPYSPGTIVAMSGKIVQHQVVTKEGHQLCLAFYM